MCSKENLQRISKITATDSTLITLYSSNTTPELMINELKKIGNRIKNIKDAFRRNKMQKILSLVFDLVESQGVKLYKNVAIYAGIIKNKEIVEYLKVPNQVNFDKIYYYCDFNFQTELLQEELYPSEKIGVAIVLAKNCVLHQVNLRLHKVMDKITMSKKASKGDYLSMIANSIQENFSKPHIIGFIVAGPGNLKKELANQLNPKPHSILDTSDRATVDSLSKTLEETFINIKYSAVITHLDEILSNLDQPKVVYGLREISKMLEYQQLEILYTNRPIKVEANNCKIIQIPKELKDLRKRLKEIGGAIGWKYY